MDQKKTGKFIADLRRANNLTQQQLGEKIGVTNKTISRWENGNYMPDIDMLQILSQEFHVSINELLSGKKLNNEEFRKKADENIRAVSKQSTFSFAEKKKILDKKMAKRAYCTLCVLGNIRYCISYLLFYFQ